MSIAASIVGCSTACLGQNINDDIAASRSMIGMIKSLDLNISSMEEDDSLTVITGRHNGNISGKIILIVDATVKAQTVSCDELYILGKSRVYADVVTAKTLVVWASSFKADYVSAKYGHIAADTLDVGKMKPCIKVYGPGQHSYDWREMTSSVKEMLESLKENDDLSSSEDIDKFVASNYGAKSVGRTITLSEDDEDDETSELRSRIEAGMDEYHRIFDPMPHGNEVLAYCLKTIRHEELKDALTRLLMTPEEYDSAMEDLIALLQDEEESEKIASAMDDFMAYIKDEDFLRVLILNFAHKDQPQAQATPAQPVAAPVVDNSAANSQVELTKEDWETIDGLTNKQFCELLYGYVPEDVAGTDKQKSKAVLLSEIKMLAHVDKRFHEYASKYLEILRNTSWEEAKKDPSLIHSETVAEAKAEAKAEEQSEITNDAAEPDSTQQADTQVA